jgi:hypothetical protein
MLADKDVHSVGGSEDARSPTKSDHAEDPTNRVLRAVRPNQGPDRRKRQREDANDGSARNANYAKESFDIEIWPTCIALPAGYRIALSVRGKDYVYPGGSGGKLSNMKNEFTGVGPFLHNDARDRPPEIFDGTVTLHTGGNRASWVMLPVIPER